MTEQTSLEVVASSVEEALAQGLAKLGLPAEAVSIEVLDAGTKGFLGLGGKQVRVRLTANPTGMPAPAAAPAPAPVPVPAPAPAEKRPAKAEKPARVEKQAEAPAPAAPALEPGEHDETLDSAESLISKLLFLMGLQAQVSAHYGEPDREGRLPIHVDIRGEDLGVLIGRRSETLNAFQYMCALLVGKQIGRWVQLVVDVEGYRSRREHQLRQMAVRLAEQAIKTGRRVVLEPMNAAERRIIHLELRGHPAVTTESIGEDPLRKVTIIPKNE